jgi:hypothetical protein
MKLRREARAAAGQHDSEDLRNEDAHSLRIRKMLALFVSGASACVMLTAMCLQQPGGTGPHEQRIDDARRSLWKRANASSSSDTWMDNVAVSNGESLYIAAVVFIIALWACSHKKAAPVGDEEKCEVEPVVKKLVVGSVEQCEQCVSVLPDLAVRQKGSKDQAPEEQALLSNDVGGNVVRSGLRHRHTGSANELTYLKEILDRRKWSHEFEVKEGRSEQEYCARVVIHKDHGDEILAWGEPGLGKRMAKASAARIALRSDLLNENTAA